jgi:hypothetical protein
MKRVLTIVLLLLCFKTKAQFLDSLNVVFRSKSIIDARLESRYSFIRNNLIAVTGIRLGVAYKRKLRIGGGISWLKTDRAYSFYQRDAFGELFEIKKYLKFAYLCYYIDFVYYRTKRWQLSVPIQAGTGLAWFQKETNYSLLNADRKHFLVLYEPGITVQFKVFKYLGLGGDAAFRFVFNREKKIGEQLNSPTFSVKALFWPDQLFYVLAPNSKLSKKRGPAEW